MKTESRIQNLAFRLKRDVTSELQQAFAMGRFIILRLA